MPIGINVLANGAVQALAVAKASGASFIRVNQWANAYVANEGFMEGKAGQASRYRAWLRGRRTWRSSPTSTSSTAPTPSPPTGRWTELTRDSEFFDADAVIVTGQRTGDSARL